MFITSLALLSSCSTTKPIPPQSGNMNAMSCVEVPRIEIRPMRQRLQIQNLEEDWTGTSSTVLRRKLQNRLNQRASRQRRKVDSKRLEAITKVIETQGPIILDPTTPPPKEYMCINHVDVKRIVTSTSFNSYITDTSIPADSYLLTLLHFNIIRALSVNVEILKIPVDRMDDNILSPFNTLPSTQYPQGIPDLSNLPLALKPTSLQFEIEHHPEIDVFPFPGCRDLILLALSRGDEWDDIEFCRDIMYGLEGGGGRTGFIVWGDPWIPGSWEVEENFARKWKWLLEGCEELFVSTNIWRDRRGEERLVFEELS
ncbi:uncharacterized protein EAF01_011542 [Botrytis porri]|uniref:BZIP domain-containing protein n=1 Tax=Botrytis porri TaxID=87229 RepID=A0A4Z1KJY7_9HELO|nr:uncharacterized protein EAF01_011542 [Botrytis porri]KAF7884119.1 hypothetical protein EAF01_011542 [Botrytis porri]TGO81503.1 hypothetical protein BPOR_1127g00010 [Botrytis porri]